MSTTIDFHLFLNFILWAKQKSALETVIPLTAITIFRTPLRIYTGFLYYELFNF
nr:MAG TPA: hypothetical protein [Caudoviricetes sp.]